MCLLERREATIPPLNMTLAARLSPPNSCVAVPLSNLSGVASCPNCRHEFRVALPTCGKHAGSAPASLTPHYTVQPWPHSTHCHIQPWPHLQQYTQAHSPLCSVPTSPYNDELMRLAETLKALRLSGWYYGNLDWQGARSLLKDASVGAFLIRDSGDRLFIFSLSVQTERGPTSVRLHYEDGYFRLDCDKHLARYMPRFGCVVDLIQHYMRMPQRGGAGTVWVDREGCPHSPVLLKTPLRKSPPSLLHCARIAVHKALDSNPLTPKLRCAPKHRLLPLPSTLIDYLGEYPYPI